MTRAPLIITLVVAAACGETTQTTPQDINIDAPVDITFACFGGLRLTNGGSADPSQQVLPGSAQPLSGCDIRSQLPAPGATTTPVPPGQEDLSGAGGANLPGVAWYALILQHVRGTVAIATFSTKPATSFAGGDVSVVNANPLAPGKNSITVGELPVAIGTDKIGCFAVTANAGTCDLSTIDISSALGSALNVPGHGLPIIDRLAVTNAAGQPIRAKPAALAMEPPAGTIGVQCPAHATGLAYVAYPGCHLVAGVDTSSGTIITGIQYDATGVPSIVDGNVTCPDECAEQATTPGVRPVTLDLKLDPRSGRKLLAIGSDNSPALALVELDANSLPLSMTQMALQNTIGDLGVTKVTISPQMGMGGSTGVVDDTTAPGGQMQFVYAVATDATVRVAEVLNVNAECDTQIDPRFLNAVRSVKTLSCIPVGSTNPPRRPGARGPGIELVNTSIISRIQNVPTSVDVIKVDTFVGDQRLQGPGKLVGYFGVITAMNGGTYMFNITDDDFPDLVDANNPVASPIPLVMAHQLRDNVPDRGLIAETLVNNVEKFICNDDGPDPTSNNGANDGGPRLAGINGSPAEPQKSLPAGTIDPSKAGNLPDVHHVLCTGTDAPSGVPVSELAFSAPLPVRDLAYPDLLGLHFDETWTLTWEGPLSNDISSTALSGPIVRQSQFFVDANGLHVVDASRPFCGAGVEPFDVVQLRGCNPANGDTDCPLGYTCFIHPQSQVAGLGACMLATEADRLANACEKFLTSLRRYTVGKSTSGELVLLPRAHVLLTTPVDGCTSDAQCTTLATYAAQNVGAANPIDDTTPPDTHKWSCAVDPNRKPGIGADGGPLRRCIMRCQADADCDTGTVCDIGTSTCMEGVTPPQSCVNAPQRYDLRAGEAFTVLGTRSGYVHPIIADANNNCVPDPNASPWSIGRVPLVAPPCDPTADPRTGKKSDGTFDANPCQTTVTEVDEAPQFVANTCTQSGASVVEQRPTTGIRFRSRGLTYTVVDPTYHGDATCIGDRGGMLGNIPLVFPGFQLVFRQTAGFSPMQLPITPVLPIKVVRGPTQSIWVIDNGTFVSSTITTASSRGRVYRVEGVSLSTVNELE
jgi:hypothetical protein